eukprot:5714716-Pyramimonas_sp.AAC.1
MGTTRDSTRGGASATTSGHAHGRAQTPAPCTFCSAPLRPLGIGVSSGCSRGVSAGEIHDS